MTEEQKRIAVAESLGWQKIHVNNATKHVVGYLLNQPIETYGQVFTEIPNYPADLNATHKAERALTNKESAVFANELRRILGFYSHTYFDLAHATAAQRCEAYLRVKGLWKEDAK